MLHVQDQIGQSNIKTLESNLHYFEASEQCPVNCAFIKGSSFDRHPTNKQYWEQIAAGTAVAVSMRASLKIVVSVMAGPQALIPPISVWQRLLKIHQHYGTYWNNQGQMGKRKAYA
jgi:hypothetical protein